MNDILKNEWYFKVFKSLFLLQEAFKYYILNI